MEEKEVEEKIEALRETIEIFDRQLFQLLEKRLEISTEIGRLKSELGNDIYDGEREREVVQNVLNSDTDLPDDFVKFIMEIILQEMRKISEQQNG